MLIRLYFPEKISISEKNPPKKGINSHLLLIKTNAGSITNKKTVITKISFQFISTPYIWLNNKLYFLYLTLKNKIP